MSALCWAGGRGAKAQAGLTGARSALSRSNSRLFIDTAGTAHLPEPSNPGSVTSTLHKGVISILLLQVLAAESLIMVTHSKCLCCPRAISTIRYGMIRLQAP